jgi:hypothetical protein
VRYFDVEIVFTDGSTETIQSATDAHPVDGVLHLRRDGDYGLREHLGSYPLVNVKSWKKATS